MSNQSNSQSGNEGGYTFWAFVTTIILTVTGIGLVYAVSGRSGNPLNTFVYSLIAYTIALVISLYMTMKAKKEEAKIAWIGMASINALAYFVGIGFLCAVAFLLTGSILGKDIFYGAATFMTCFLGYRFLREYVIYKKEELDEQMDHTWKGLAVFLGFSEFYGGIWVAVFGLLLWVKVIFGLVIACWCILGLCGGLLIGLMVFQFFRTRKAKEGGS